jgi:putative two-component system response regulator
MTERSKILVVDDELGPRESLRMILRDDYHVETAATGKQAIELIKSADYDLVILDIRMPEMSGIELLKVIREITPSTEVIMITAYASIETATEALRLGAIDYLIKPFEISSVREVIGKGLQKRNDSRIVNDRISELQQAKITLEEEIKNTYSNIQSHYRETIDSLVAAVDAKDSYTKGHQERVAGMVGLIGSNLDLSESDLQIIRQAATLHDIGKIGVEERILRKNSGLNSKEYEMVKRHPVIGADIISPATFLKDLVPLVLYHHERYDGMGYPEGLKNVDIPLGARIIAVADSIDAMLWERPYAVSKSVPEVEEELIRVAGTQLDPDIVNVIIAKKLLNSLDVSPGIK